MTDRLLPHYNRELAYVRRLASEFAAAHPGVAEHLGISEDRIADPHVSRLIEAFAYLNARTRQKIDDDFPEITEALLSVLYPHYLAPFPSSAIVQLALDRGQQELTGGYRIERRANVLTDPIDGEPCRFQTRFPVTLWPMEVEEASYSSPPVPAPMVADYNARSRSVVRIVLRPYSTSVPLSEFSLGPLRFFLHGHGPYMHHLYEALLNDAVGAAVATSPLDKAPIALPASSLQPVGFERDQGLIEYSPQSFLGYRLLQEFFVLPEKFLFVDFHGLSREALRAKGQGAAMELYIFLDQESRELQRNVGPETFRLGCTPIANLFSKEAEPIRLSHRQFEYRVVPDARQPRHFEVHSVDHVAAISPDGEERPYTPFYSLQHRHDSRQPQAFWHASRRAAEYRGGLVDGGTEVYLSLVDLGFDLSAPEDWTLQVSTTCLNRDLPSQFDFGGGQPRLHLESGGPIASLRCLTKPTPALRPELRDRARWRLLSHLSLGHLSLVAKGDDGEALREILRLYNPRDSRDANALIDGVAGVACRRVVGRVGGAVSAGFCRGLEVTLTFDEEKYVSGGLFLFASLLERFLGLYCSLNSFTKTVARTNRRELPLRVWPPRAGEKVLL